MPSFLKLSAQRLSTCDERLQRLFNEVVKHFDCAILVGHRGKFEQDTAYEDGKSKKKWPDSKHNSLPSKAVDVAPFPIVWKDENRFIYFAGFVMGIAQGMGIKLRWGGDWDNDKDQNDQKFFDRVHFELVE